MWQLNTLYFLALLLWRCIATHSNWMNFSREKMVYYRDRVEQMFYHAYNGYLDHAFPLDELKPISCTGMDTWGSFSLTLVDSLDTLIIMGNYSEFERAADLVLQSIDFDANVNVSVFETNIRVIGGLIAAHMLSGIAGTQLEDGWPCTGPLLRLAERLANKILPAFNTYTGMPFGTINLRYGVHKSETPVTCTAGVGTFLIEFGTLSRLTGNPHYERIAMRAMNELWKHKSAINLVGNHINVQTAQWTATDSGIGAGVDSYFEYLVKGSILLNRPELMRQFKVYKEAIESYIQHDDWFLWVSMTKGQVSMPVFQSLEQFWPGLLTLVGDIEPAMRIIMSYRQVLKQLGFSPEFYNVPNMEPVSKRSGYPLRPELAESLMYLYHATHDPLLLQIGVEIIEAIEHSSKTPCGYATVHNVLDHTIEDRMESFFLSETVKYLYLLFDPDNFIHNPGLHARVVETTNGKCVIEAGGYVFNTEAHPIDPGILYCCDKRRHDDLIMLDRLEENLDLVDLLGFGHSHLDAEFELHDSDLPDVLMPPLPVSPTLQSPSDSEETTVSDVDVSAVADEASGSSEPSLNSHHDRRTNAGLAATNDTSKESMDLTESANGSTAGSVGRRLLSVGLAEPPRNLAPTAPNSRTTETGSEIKVSFPELMEEDVNFSEAVIQTLQKLVDSMNSLTAVSNIVDNAAVEMPCDFELEDSCLDRYCRIVDQDTRSVVLNRLLRIIYQRKFPIVLNAHQLCRPSEEPQESSQYRRELPDFGKLRSLDDDALGETVTVTNLQWTQAGSRDALRRAKSKAKLGFELQKSHYLPSIVVSGDASKQPFDKPQVPPVQTPTTTEMSSKHWLTS